jgi:chromosome partitioning protein
MIISVAHTKGGVGKSTIAWNLATQLESKYNIEIIDLDFQKTLTYTNEFRDKPFKVRNFDNLKDLNKYIAKDNDARISIIDVGGFDSDINRMSIIMSDIVITPVSDSGTELLGLMRFEGSS